MDFTARWPTAPVQTSTAEVAVRRVGPRQAVLLIDGMESSYHDLDDPTHLDFEYMQQMTASLDTVLRPPAPIRALHLGGAGCSLATAWAASRPTSAQLAVEWDAELTRLVREWFPLPRSPRLRIRNADARQALEGFPPGRWDVVVRDVFSNGVVPPHVRDDDAARAAARVISTGGLYLVNTTDAPPLEAARAEASTLRRHFGYVRAILEPGLARGRRYGNVVLVARHEPLDEVELAKRLRRLPVPARLTEL